MADFKPGDEVVCVGDHAPGDPPPYVKRGQVYTVEEVFVSPDPAYSCCDCQGIIGLALVEIRDDDRGFCVCMFRKVERKSDSLSIEAFLTIKPGQFEEPTRKAPAKKREKV